MGQGDAADAYEDFSKVDIRDITGQIGVVLDLHGVVVHVAAGSIKADIGVVSQGIDDVQAVGDNGQHLAAVDGLGKLIGGGPVGDKNDIIRLHQSGGSLPDGLFLLRVQLGPGLIQIIVRAGDRRWVIGDIIFHITDASVVMLDTLAVLKFQQVPAQRRVGAASHLQQFFGGSKLLFLYII